jgi:hypothetical protein
MVISTRITLRYPNGRLHHEVIQTEDHLVPGSVFERYGHTWVVVEESKPRSRYDRSPVRLVCELPGAPALAA